MASNDVLALRSLRMTQYRYENGDLSGAVKSGVIWECLGQVTYQSPWGATDWHGSMEHRADGFVELRFNCRGSGHPLRTVMFLRQTESLYKGYDDAARHITLLFWDALSKPLTMIGPLSEACTDGSLMHGNCWFEACIVDLIHPQTLS